MFTEGELAVLIVLLRERIKILNDFADEHGAEEMNHGIYELEQLQLKLLELDRKERGYIK